MNVLGIQVNKAFSAGDHGLLRFTTIAPVWNCCQQDNDDQRNEIEWKTKSQDTTP